MSHIVVRNFRIGRSEHKVGDQWQGSESDTKTLLSQGLITEVVPAKLASEPESEPVLEPPKPEKPSKKSKKE